MNTSGDHRHKPQAVRQSDHIRLPCCVIAITMIPRRNWCKVFVWMDHIHNDWSLLTITSPRNWERCKVLWWVCLSVCLPVCLPTRITRNHTNDLQFLVHVACGRTHLKTGPNFIKISMSVTCCRGSVFLWRRSDTLCTSGFVDEVMFSRKNPSCILLSGVRTRHAQQPIFQVPTKSCEFCIGGNDWYTRLPCHTCAVHTPWPGGAKRSGGWWQRAEDRRLRSHTQHPQQRLLQENHRRQFTTRLSLSTLYV